MFWILILILLATLFYFYVFKPLTIFREIGVPQESLLKCIPTNYFAFIKGITLPDFMLEVYNKFPGSRYHGFYNLNRPVLVLKDLDLIKQMLVKDNEHFNEHKEFVPAEADPLFARNLFALKGNQWKNMRSALSPSFTGSKMKGIFLLMDEYSRNFINFFLNKDEDLIEIDMKDVSSRYCNDIIASTAFGTAVDSFINPDNEFFLSGKKLTDFRSFFFKVRLLICMAFPSVSKAFNIPLMDPTVTQFFENLIKDVIKYRRESGDTRQDMIQILLETQKGCVKTEEQTENIEFASVEEHIKTSDVPVITDDDIVSQAIIFFFAGFESSSTMMCFMAYELCVNQDIQEKLREEILETSARCGDKITYEHLTRMKYLDMVVTESLRKWPAQVGVERVCIKPYTIEPVLPNEQQAHLYKDLTVFLPIYGIHHDPNNFPDPSKFDPERFNDENKRLVKSLALQPFGVGPRNCIGSRFALLEAKMMFYYLLKHFKIVPVEKTVVPIQLGKNIFSILPYDGFWMGLEKC
nr:cytochrome P450 [Agasicles hygrophila]